MFDLFCSSTTSFAGVAVGVFALAVACYAKLVHPLFADYLIADRYTVYAQITATSTARHRSLERTRHVVFLLSLVCCVWCVMHHDSLYFTFVFAVALFWCLSHLYFSPLAASAAPAGAIGTTTPISGSTVARDRRAAAVRVAIMIWICFIMANLAAVFMDGIAPREFVDLVAPVSTENGSATIRHLDDATRREASKSCRGGDDAAGVIDLIRDFVRRVGSSECDAFGGAKHIGLLPFVPQTWPSTQSTPAPSQMPQLSVAPTFASPVRLHRRDGSLDGYGNTIVLQRDAPLVISGARFHLSRIRIVSSVSASVSNNQMEELPPCTSPSHAPSTLLVVASHDVTLSNVVIQCGSESKGPGSRNDDRNLPCLLMSNAVQLDNVIVELNASCSIRIKTIMPASGYGPADATASTALSCEFVASDAGPSQPCDAAATLFQSGLIRLFDDDNDDHPAATRNTWVWPCASNARRVAMLLPGAVASVRSTVQTLFPMVSTIVGDVILPATRVALHTIADISANVACGFMDARDSEHELLTRTTTAVLPLVGSERGFRCLGAKTQEAQLDGSQGDEIREPVSDLANVGTDSNGNSNRIASSSSALIDVGHDSVVRVSVRGGCRGASWLAGSVGWQIVVWCWTEERLAVEWILSCIYDVAAFFVQCVTQTGAVATPLLSGFAKDYVAPLAAAAADVSIASALFVARGYFVYVSYAIDLKGAIYQAMWAPVVTLTSITVGAAYSFAAWSIDTVLSVTFQTHFIVFLVQTAVLVYVTWHATPYAAQQQQPQPANALQLLVSSTIGARYGAMLDWVVLSSFVQHVTSMGVGLLRYAYQSMAAVLFVWLFRAIPFIGGLRVIVEALGFPAATTVAFADALGLNTEEARRAGRVSWQQLLCLRTGVSVFVQLLFGSLIEAMISELTWLVFCCVIVFVGVAGIRIRSFFQPV